MSDNGRVMDLEREAVGRIGCPPGQEANVDEFYFWVAPEQLVEQTQIVRVPTLMGGASVELFGVVEQVYRRSTISTMHMELAAHDGDPVADDLMLDRDGVTYAKARVVNAFPPKLAPPVEGSRVELKDNRFERVRELARTDGFRPEPSRTSASWVWSGPTPTGERVCLRKRFTLESAPTRAVLSLTADPSCEVWLNGQRVGTANFAETRPSAGQSSRPRNLRTSSATMAPAPSSDSITFPSSRAACSSSATARSCCSRSPRTRASSERRRVSPASSASSRC